MPKAQKLSRFVGLCLTFLLILGVGVFCGLCFGSHLHKNSMEAEIEHHTDCDCDHCHDCEDCHEHRAQALLATGTYYTNNGSFYTLTSSSSTQHYHCTNSQHSGGNDYTSSSVSGTCYTTYPRAGYSTQYYGHSCSVSAYGSHNVSTSTSNGPHHYVYKNQARQGIYRYQCSHCGTTTTRSTKTSSYDTGSCSSHVITTYSCSSCGYSGSSSPSGTCSGNPTQWKCSYCQQTFSTNRTDACGSRPWKKCNVCSGNWDSCSCTTTSNHGHSISNYYVAYSYTYKNIDTNQSTTVSSAFSQATGFTVSFNINSSNATGPGTTGGSMNGQYMLHGHSEALTSNAFTFSGHRFLGWSTSATATTATYTNGQSINLSTSNVSSGGTLTLYAIWKYQLAKPTATNTNLTYTGDTNNPLHPTFSNVDTTYMNSGGTQSAVNSGSYTATFSLKDTNKTEWADQSVAAVSINWSIAKQSLTKVTLSGNDPTYTSSNQTRALSNFDSNTMDKTGDLSATNVKTSGNYSITISLKDTANYQWSDGTTDNLTLTWNVRPVDIEQSGGLQVTIGENSFVYDGAPKTPEPTVTI